MLNKDYVLGIVDGEGSFNIQINEKRKNPKIDLKFSLKLRHQDKEILEELQNFFGCGKIYIQNDKRKNHSLCYRFEVFNRKELFEKIIPFFEENSPKISSRKRDFQIFKEIADLIQKENLDLGKIKVLKSKMHWKN
jgi:predicted nucleotidyltransferase